MLRPYLSDDASAEDAELRLQPRDRAAQHPSPTVVGLACYYRDGAGAGAGKSASDSRLGPWPVNRPAGFTAPLQRGDAEPRLQPRRRSIVTFRFTTAGESHGRGLVGVLEGIPAGLPVSADRIDAELQRRMGGYGRGARMKIEADRIEWLSGLRAGETLGSPIAMLVWNRDWEHWRDVMAPEADPPGAERRRQVTRPRPGHADLAGALKYDRRDARDILERASARETVARVACGAICKLLLEQFGIEIGSHVVELGGVTDSTGATAGVGATAGAGATAGVRAAAGVGATAGVGAQ